MKMGIIGFAVLIALVSTNVFAQTSAIMADVVLRRTDAGEELSLVQFKLPETPVGYVLKHAIVKQSVRCAGDGGLQGIVLARVLSSPLETSSIEDTIAVYIKEGRPDTLKAVDDPCASGGLFVNLTPAVQAQLERHSDSCSVLLWSSEMGGASFGADPPLLVLVWENAAYPVKLFWRFKTD